MLEHKLNPPFISVCPARQRFTKLSLISDLLCNDKLSPCWMRRLSGMLLSTYIILCPSLYRPDSGLLNMQQMLFLP